MLRTSAVQIFVTNRAFNMFKIGLDNRDFCKSLHFYIVDAGKKKKKEKKKKSSCICWLVQLLSALTIFFLCCGALASALIRTTNHLSPLNFSVANMNLKSLMDEKFLKVY